MEEEINIERMDYLLEESFRCLAQNSICIFNQEFPSFGTGNLFLPPPKATQGIFNSLALSLILRALMG